MAKRKRAYGSTKAQHRTKAGENLHAARLYARRIRADLAQGRCVAAFSMLTALNRVMGRAQVQISSARGGAVQPGSARGGGGGLYRTVSNLDRKFVQKCLR